AHDLANGVGRNAGIERSGIELGVTEQDLDHSDIDVLFQKMRGETVPQCMRRHALVDLGHLGSSVAGAVELPRRHWIDGVLAREQPRLRPCNTIPIPQQLKQLRGKHRVAILAALALLDTQHHAFGVDIADFEHGDFGDAQACTISDAERCFVFDAGGGLQEPYNLLWAQDDWHLARLAYGCKMLAQVRTSECDIEEKSQRCDGAVDLWYPSAGRRQ